MAVTCRYHMPEQPKVPSMMIKEMDWYCERCDQTEREMKEVLEPTDRVRIINRFLRFSDDFDMLGVKIEALPDELLFHIRLPNFDMSEMRAIQYKQQETGFITVQELIRLQKAGFSRPREVPPKPQPRNRRILRERARQRAFAGDPRPI
jgi:hypothetical protein